MDYNNEKLKAQCQL